MFQGQTINLSLGGDGIAELQFDAKGESVNKFDRRTIGELKDAVAALASSKDVHGVLITSAKGVFVVGADITEFTELFKLPEAELAQWPAATCAVFSAFEDLPVPKVCAINGFALGGGLEIALCCDYRVMSSAAQVGLPEVKLGLFPGFGGTVRMPRLVGVDNAVEWISAGGQHKAEKALADGVVDAVAAPDHLAAAARAMLRECIDGKLDWRARHREKLAPIKLPPMENLMAFTTTSALVAQQAGRNFPAPLAAVKTMQAHADKSRDEAMAIESREFAKIARTSVATALSGLFLSDQYLKKESSRWQKQAAPISFAAILGAGIMGGGIAHQSASRGVPAMMKDIRQEALDLGMAEANKLVAKQVSRGRLAALDGGNVLAAIKPTLHYDNMDKVDIVVEAVVENIKVKTSVLAEVEQLVRPDTIIASNTSTISISRMAESLERPQNFVGMHFFNPVHAMPLVEVIRGRESSDAAVAATVSYALKLGKNPIVVNDCPGFLVNRVLFPYFAGFAMLVRDGADFEKVDKVMEKFGWPMGPAYLGDVVGLDTAVHAAGVLAEGFPDRMQPDFRDASTLLYEAGRYGQKNGRGYYTYTEDKKGRPIKAVDPAVWDLFAGAVGARRDFEPQEVIDRMMIPMCNETVRCLEDDIVATVAEADMAMIYGIGFPLFRGGPLRYIDSLGTRAFVETCAKYSHLGPLYQPPQRLLDLAAADKAFYG